MTPNLKSIPVVYVQASPAQSSTSLSENDDDDVNRSTFFASVDPVAVGPAQWSTRSSFLPIESSIDDAAQSLASHLPPELLIHILKHLHSPRDLYHVMLVSRGWAECSVELLWHKPAFTSLSTLVKMIRVLASSNQSFTYARFIRRLNFLSLGSELTDVVFSRFAQCIRLERLTLVNCTNISDSALIRVLPSCPNLVAVDLTGVSDTTDHTVVALAAACPRLQGINLGGCKQVTNKGVLALARHCRLLRRVKLSGLEDLTDDAVSMLAKYCPLLLEIDLNGCKRITDVGVRDLWMYSMHMREMRLSHCAELTDAAFPALPIMPADGPPVAPFPRTTPADSLLPLHLPHTFGHLRMLDLTACSLITDSALAGIISVSPKIRNLVLAKSTQISDIGIESICRLGKQLHYLHLGHASNVTDRGVKMLARSCTRLRYIDLANCSHLTDLSVFELSTLQKLRRIGLVRVHNLTDEAIYSLADRHATLERIHLSYCEQISVIAVHFLLQRLRKLTHLSLTGIPSFRRPELQQFCRVPPQEFNQTQREQFCVYSGKGIAQLRDYLTSLFNTISDGGTVYAGEVDGEDDEDVRTVGYNGGEGEGDDAEDEDDDDDDVDDVGRGMQNVVVERGRSAYRGTEPVNASHPDPRSDVNIGSPAPYPNVTRVFARRMINGFGHEPIVESSAPTSPAPSDGSSTGNGATFFRRYDHAGSTSAIGSGVAPESVTRHGDGVLTPDLVFAEIGHGRGTGSGQNGSGSGANAQNREGREISATWEMVARVAHQSAIVNLGMPNPLMPRQQPVMSLMPQAGYPYGHGYGFDRQAQGGNSNLYDQRSHQGYSGSSSSGRIREDSAQSSLLDLDYNVPGSLEEDADGSSHPLSNPDHEPNSPNGRSRSVKSSFRNTLNAAEHYASSFLFGHGHSFGTLGGRASGSAHTSPSGGREGASADSMTGSRGR